jgi:glutathione S-transferase
MYRLHGVLDWGSQVIRLTLAELALSFDFHQIDVAAGGLTSPDLLALNPFGRVPVLETPDGPILKPPPFCFIWRKPMVRLRPCPVRRIGPPF